MLKNYLNDKTSMPDDEELLKIIENEVNLLVEHDLQADFIALCDLCFMLKSIKAPYWLPGKTANSYLLYLLGVTSFNPLSYNLNFKDCFRFKNMPKTPIFELRMPMFYVEDSVIFLAKHELLLTEKLSDTSNSFKISNISLVKFLEEPQDILDGPPFTHPTKVGNIFGDTIVKFVLTDYHDEQFHKLLSTFVNSNEALTFEHCLKVLGLQLGTWNYPDKIQAFLDLKLDILTAPIFAEDNDVVFKYNEIAWLASSQYLFPKAHCIEYFIYQFRCAKS